MKETELPEKTNFEFNEWYDSVCKLENQLNKIIDYLKAKEEEKDR